MSPYLPRNLVARARRSLTRLARFTNQIQRTHICCGPVTVQQCHTLEALANGPLPMNRLADEVALHPSTLTRVVEKLEERKLLVRRRPAHNQRTVQVELTAQGRDLHAGLDTASDRVVERILALVAARHRRGAVRGLEIICDLLDPQNDAAREIIAGTAKTCNFPHKTGEAS